MNKVSTNAASGSVKVAKGYTTSPRQRGKGAGYQPKAKDQSARTLQSLLTEDVRANRGSYASGVIQGKAKSLVPVATRKGGARHG